MPPLPKLIALSLSTATAAVLSGCGGSAPSAGAPEVPSENVPKVTSEAFSGAQLSSGMFRSRLLDPPVVTKFEGDGAGGFGITYRVDGADRTVRFAGSDYEADPEFAEAYYRQLGNWIYVVERETPRGSLLGDPEFDHFDIYYTELLETGDDASILGGSVGYFVHGTSAQTLPAGTAEYSGRVLAKLVAPVSPSHITPSRGWLRSSNLSLTLDFTDSSVSGAIDGIEHRLRDQDAYEPVAGRFTINGMIAGNASGTGLRADVTGTGELATWDVAMEGQTFGPQAMEVGGVLTGTNSADDYKLIGYFGAAAQ